MFTARRAVFFGAHTDDEMICAGTLHRLARSGCEVHVISFGTAATKHDRHGTVLSWVEVEKEWERSLDLIGVKPHRRKYVGFYPSSDFQPRRQEVCQAAFDYCERVKPDLVLTLSPEDENTAHSIVGVETERVMRGRVPQVLRCHFPWNYGLGKPNLYVTLEEQDLAVKRAVIEAYQSQHFRYSYQELLLSCVRADGLSVKVPAAEKFEVVRWVV